MNLSKYALIAALAVLPACGATIDYSMTGTSFVTPEGHSVTILPASGSVEFPELPLAGFGRFIDINEYSVSFASAAFSTVDFSLTFDASGSTVELPMRATLQFYEGRYYASFSYVPDPTGAFVVPGIERKVALTGSILGSSSAVPVVTGSLRSMLITDPAFNPTSDIPEPSTLFLLTGGLGLLCLLRKR